MKMRVNGLILLCLLGVSACAQNLPPTAVIVNKTPFPALTTVAAKCDLSQCQTNCYVNESTCQNNGNSGCSSQAQMCVQSCSSQCQ